MNLHEISPETFVKTVLYTLHKNYPMYRTQIFRRRAMKLVLEVADSLGYSRLPNGFFKSGRFSFVADAVFDQLRYDRSLQGITIRPSEINAPLSVDLGPILARYKEWFTGDAGRDMPWRYADNVPKKYQKFYAVYQELDEALKQLPGIKGKKDLLASSESIPAIITRFEFCLIHVDEKNLQLYYDYTGLLENVLIAIHDQSVPISSVKPVLSDLYEIYKSGVSAILPPFIDTLDGINTDKEVFLYRRYLADNEKHTLHKLHIFKEKAQKLGLAA